MYSEKFKLYKEEVVKAFLEKSEQANASWLVDLNRRKIRDYCIERIESGVDPNDHRALSDYLKMKAGDQDYLTAIHATDADYFQGLFQFLEKPTKNPASTTVEMVSWLVEFPHRPYANYIKEESFQPVVLEKEKATVRHNEGQNDAIDKKVEEPVIPSRSTRSSQEEEENIFSRNLGTMKADRPIEKQLNTTYKRWMIGITALLTITVIYWYFANDAECMYWDKDQYVATSCSVPRAATPFIALDTARQKSFKRITRIDTLTRSSVGKLWWVSINGQIEIYTAGGKHPLYPNKDLKMVTDYVINVVSNRKLKR